MLDVLGDAVADHLDTTALHALLDGEAATKAPAVSKKPRTGRTTVTFSRTTGASTAVDLRHHGDAEVAPGMLDFAVNVLVPPPPAWLHDALSRQLTQLAAYPDPTAARAAAARHHGIGPEQVLPTNGAAEAFSLIARARPWRHPVVVHPQFTEPEAALAAAGHAVARVVLDVAQGFALDVAAVPDDADLVVVDNPTNPTSVLHPRAALERLRRPGRVLVADEAFLDVTADPDGASLVGSPDSEDVVVVRSLTKSFGLAGLRAGYLVASTQLVADCVAVQPPWSVSTLAATAIEACLGERGEHHLAGLRAVLPGRRAHLVRVLSSHGFVVTEPAAGPFVLARHPRAAAVREALRHLGVAVRRGDTFRASTTASCGSPCATRRPSTLSGQHCPPSAPASTQIWRGRDPQRPTRDEPGQKGAPGDRTSCPARVGPRHDDRRRGPRRCGCRRGGPHAAGRPDQAAGLHGGARRARPPAVRQLRRVPTARARAGGDRRLRRRPRCSRPGRLAVAAGGHRADGRQHRRRGRGHQRAGPTGRRIRHRRRRRCRWRHDRAAGTAVRKVRRRTADLTLGPAMTVDDANAAVEVGIEVANLLVGQGNRLLVTGDLGIANTTPAAALVAVFTGRDAAEVTGRGAGSDDAMLAHKVEVIRGAIRRSGATADRPLEALAAVGGFEHAALVGFLLAAASRRTPVVLDGVIACSAALVARALCPGVTAYLVAGHRSRESGASVAMQALGLEPLLDLGLRLGEGTGAALAVPLVQAAARLLREVATFGSAGVSGASGT